MTLPLGPFRPNTAKVERLVTGATSNAGDPIEAPQTIYAALPCLVDMMPRGGDIVDSKVGPIISQVYTLYADGIPAGGAAAGTTITVGGVAYLVSENGRNAFPDVQKGDRVTDERGRTFLVVAVAQYYDIAPGIQAHLRAGEAFG